MMSDLIKYKKIVKSKYSKAKIYPIQNQYGYEVKGYNVIEKAERGGVLIGFGKTEIEAWQKAALRTLRIIENAR